MLTLFDIFQMAGIVVGVAVGCIFGENHGGPHGRLIGAFVGLVAGAIVGRLPLAISSSLIRRAIRRASVDELHRRLEHEYYLSHLFIAELVVRGESAESFRSIIEQQLASPSAEVKRFGQANARLWLN